MKKFALVSALAALAVSSALTSAQAQRRPYSPDMNCGAVAQFVRMNGAAVVRTGPNTYDRYVSHRGHCTPQETTRPAWVTSIDEPACFIGYTCEPITNRSLR